MWSKRRPSRRDPTQTPTLLAAMKNAGREIEDDELAAAMKESGLGTPATRAETIEKLIRTGYVVRDPQGDHLDGEGQSTRRLGS